MLEQLPILGPLLTPGIELLLAASVEPELTTFPALAADDIAAFETEFEIALPEDFCQLYLETNGFTLSWEDGSDWGTLSLPCLDELRLFRQRWVNGQCPAREQLTDATDSRAQAILTAAPLWLPFEEEGNGDLLCIDCGTGAVVEASHDWGDASEINGTAYASSITEYISKCGSFSFRSVHSLDMDRAVYDGVWRVIWPG